MKNENTDTLVDQARDYDSDHGCGSIGGCVHCMAGFARKVAREAVRRREAEIAEKIGEILDRSELRQKKGSE